ncbi:hypothetical protein C0J52_06144 [Blattella germanica]|nr:hypothetical protein C0J52_06144 [Blattella germanica]
MDFVCKLRTSTLIYAVFLTGCAYGLLGRGDLLINSIPGDLDDAKCDRLADEVARADRDTIAEDPPRLAGKWVSEG